MELLRQVADVHTRLATVRGAGARLGLVPTMGYLHAGHRALIAQARRECDRVAVSIFVNPTQFGPNEDFARYPRDLDRDLALCEEAGVDWVFAPEAAALYPHGPGTMVVPPAALTERLCGAFRPGHFAGVTTVVCKLFGLWQPERAYFGQKDFQQTVVIARMVEDLCLPVTLVGVPTVREPDGLALSSRNVFLGAAEREAARAIPRALQAAWEAARAPGADPARVIAAARSVLASEPGLEVQYLEAVDATTLEPADPAGGEWVVAIAAHAGRTRLIDNAWLSGPAPLADPTSRRSACG